MTWNSRAESADVHAGVIRILPRERSRTVLVLGATWLLIWCATVVLVTHAVSWFLPSWLSEKLLDMLQLQPLLITGSFCLGASIAAGVSAKSSRAFLGGALGTGIVTAAFIVLLALGASMDGA